MTEKLIKKKKKEFKEKRCKKSKTIDIYLPYLIPAITGHSNKLLHSGGWDGHLWNVWEALKFISNVLMIHKQERKSAFSHNYRRV